MWEAQSASSRERSNARSSKRTNRGVWKDRRGSRPDGRNECSVSKRDPIKDGGRASSASRRRSRLDTSLAIEIGSWMNEGRDERGEERR